MRKKTLLTVLAVLVSAGAASAQWDAYCDFGRPYWCGDGPDPSMPATDGHYYTPSQWAGAYDLANAADGTDTGADMDLTNAYYTTPGGLCNRVKDAGTDGTWDALAQHDGQAWPWGYRYDDLDPDRPAGHEGNMSPWTYEIHFTGLRDDMVYNFKLYANCYDTHVYAGDGTSSYTIGGKSLSLAHIDNYDPSETVSVIHVAPYDFQGITSFTDEGADTWTPVYAEMHGIKLELGDYSIINILQITEALKPLPGDANEDGVVDYIDLGTLATNYDLTGMAWGDGDFNYNGTVDYIDLGIMATNYGLTRGSVKGAVPEPAFAVLLGAGVVGLLRRRR